MDRKPSKLVSIDPGLSGAIAVFEDFETTPVVHDMPTMKIRGGNKRDLDVDAFTDLIMTANPDEIVIEKQQAMPKQGVSSTFQTGQNYGLLLGAIIALAYKHKIVTAASWSKAVKRPAKSGKDWNISEARRRWPDLKKILLKSKDGRADALLIGAAQMPEPVEKPNSKEEVAELPDW